MGHRAQVLLRRTEDGQFIEVATIVSRGKGKELVIRLPDGREEHHVRGINEFNVEQGSVTHRLRVAPEEIEQVLRDRPAGLFKQLLAELGKPAKASALKAKLHGVDPPLLDKAWEVARRALDQDGDVRKSSERAPTYSLASEARDANLHIAGLGAAPPAAATQSVQPPPGSATRPAMPAGEASPHVKPTDGTSRDVSASLRVARPRPDDRPAPDLEPDPLLERLRGLGILSQSEGLESLSARPLGSGLDLAKLKATELRALLDGVSPEHRSLLALLLGHGKERLLEREAQRLTAHQQELALRAGLREVLNAAGDSKRLYAQLTEMTCRAIQAQALASSFLVELARAFADAGRAGREGLDACLAALAKNLAAEGTQLASWDLGALARAARAADFGRTGGRSALVATLHRMSPTEPTHPRWWEGATFDQLSQAGHGPLAAALEDPAIAMSVVRPIVENAVQQTVTRAGLARLWLAPPPMAAWITGPALKEAIIRAAIKDPVAASWAQELTDAGEIKRLSRLLEEAEADSRSSRESEELLRQQVIALEERLRVTGEQLAAGRGHQADLRGAYERQIKLELVKAIARMAAQVSQSDAASSDDALLRSIEHAASREGLSAIETTGETVTFDPARHDPLGRAIPEKSAVVVVRHGYTWSDGAEAVTILKAQVVLVEG